MNDKYAVSANIVSISPKFLDHLGFVPLEEDIKFPALDREVSETETYETTIKPQAPVVSKYGGRLWEFSGFMQVFPGLPESRVVRKFAIWMLVRDRRVARRISRDTGRKFRMINGVAVFRDDKRRTSA